MGNERQTSKWKLLLSDKRIVWAIAEQIRLNKAQRKQAQLIFTIVVAVVVICIRAAQSIARTCQRAQLATAEAGANFTAGQLAWIWRHKGASARNCAPIVRAPPMDRPVGYRRGAAQSARSFIIAGGAKCTSAAIEIWASAGAPSWRNPLDASRVPYLSLSVSVQPV